jgi:uncharacterized delta-60 repeat protein
VRVVVRQPDGKILIGGDFTSLAPNGGASVTRNRLARLNPDGTLDTAFNPNASSIVLSLLLQPDGKILAGGAFTTIAGQTRNRIARLNPDGTLDPGFNPGASNVVYSVALQTDGKILVGGAFRNIGGQARTSFARLTNDTVAGQNLSVAQTAVSWIRDGSSPQFSRVTFEDSTDGVTYSFLGNGTAAGNNWTLTGLNLSAGQSLFIRGRGHYGSGNYSESIQETVRNTVIVADPLLNIQRSGGTDVVLSWAASSTGFTLEATTNLKTNAWSVFPAAPVVIGANNVVTDVATGAQKFYRLSGP